MKSLYNNQWNLTPEGLQLDKLTVQALKPIFDQYLEQGYTAMEIESVMVNYITAYAAEQKLRHGLKVRREAREAERNNNDKNIIN